MKIVYCIPHLYNSGGMERVLTQKVNWLAAHADYEITIITTEKTPAGQSDIYFPLDRRVRVVSWSIDFNADYTKPLWSKYIGHTRRMRAYRAQLTDFVKREQIDVCISLGGKETAFIASLPCRTMVEFHFAKNHRQQLLDANHTNCVWHLLGAMRTWQLVRDVRSVERIIVLTEHDKRDWQKAGCENVVCMPNPCSLDGQKIPLKPKEKLVLAVGRLHEQKGFDILLQAWEKVVSGMGQSAKEWTLRIVGEGSQRVALEQQIKERNLINVCLAGNVQSVAEEYAAAACFVLSSRYEGLPLALIESMWCGVPCVSFDCPHGPAELLGDDRGWLVPAMDVEKLSQQIEYALAHPDETAARAAKAQAFAQATYSEAAIMPQWKKVIEK